MVKIFQPTEEKSYKIFSCHQNWEKSRTKQSLQNGKGQGMKRGRDLGRETSRGNKALKEKERETTEYCSMF